MKKRRMSTPSRGTMMSVAWSHEISPWGQLNAHWSEVSECDMRSGNGECQVLKSKFLPFDIIPFPMKQTAVVMYILHNGSHLLYFYSPAEFTKYVQIPSVISFDPN